MIIIKNYIKTDYKICYKKNKKAVLLSRITESKIKWIHKAINFCESHWYYLDIYWWGDTSYKSKFTSKYIRFLWEYNTDNIEFEKYSIIMWMWRALLEWISRWLTPILVWYDDIIDVVDTKNFEHISKTNFSGRWVKKVKLDEKRIIYYPIKMKNNLINILKDHYSINNFYTSHHDIY